MEFPGICTARHHRSAVVLYCYGVNRPDAPDSERYPGQHSHNSVGGAEHYPDEPNKQYRKLFWNVGDCRSVVGCALFNYRYRAVYSFCCTEQRGIPIILFFNTKKKYKKAIEATYVAKVKALGRFSVAIPANRGGIL